MTQIAIVGEAYGEQEEREQTAFVGAAGYELTRLLDEVGINRVECFLTNVFNQRPPGNKIEAFCGPKAEGISGYPALLKAKYVRQEFIPELERLRDEIFTINPNLIIAMGNTPLWALCGRVGISNLRGTTLLSTHTATGFKILPTYHPANLFRQWENRPVTIVDLMKAKREAAFPEIRRPRREIWIEPTIEDFKTFRQEHITGCKVLSVDIETAGNQITCIGFAPRSDLAIVVPIIDYRRKGRNYFSDIRDELEAWRIIRGILGDATIPKLFQNGLYDIAFLWRSYGIPTFGALHDTMLLHHALQPESLKGLGFLGSVYTDEGSWKQMRSKIETIKADD